ncbi:MAG: LytTR family DNA-binding domain-containing protein [Clostridiales bacterium]|nr:LytTR family DNA-binding domain-containing protein [Clostridiales bacterium]
MRIAVCDDSGREQEELREALRACVPAEEPECFAGGKELLAAAEKMPPFDIAFLDIYLPDESGVALARNLQALSPSTGIVFVTSSLDHAVEAFSLNALHYLAKPVRTEDVAEALRRLAKLQQKKRQLIALPSGGVSYTVYLDEISYIRCEGHTKEVVLTNGKLLRTRIPMEELRAKLGDSLLKVNRSCIVNMEQIAQMGTDACILQDGTRLEFARRERAAVRAAYSNYLFACLNRRGGMEESQ